VRQSQGKAKSSQPPKDPYAVDLPQIADPFEPCPEFPAGSIGKLRDRHEFRNLSLTGVDFSGSQAENLIFDTVQLSNVNLSATELVDVRITDAIFDTCDFANSQWKELSCLRVKLTGCRITGMRCNESCLSSVLFSHTNLRLAQFRFAEFERVRFEHCDLAGADFYSADLRNAVFVDCELTEAQFCGAKLAGADIRGSRIEGLQIMPENLKGLIVDSLQAVLLSSVVGLVVKYDSNS
jgi:uncharacterized protein YjbI with pentapeptide repeats